MAEGGMDEILQVIKDYEGIDSNPTSVDCDNELNVIRKMLDNLEMKTLLDKKKSREIKEIRERIKALKENPEDAELDPDSKWKLPPPTKNVDPVKQDNAKRMSGNKILPTNPKDSSDSEESEDSEHSSNDWQGRRLHRSSSRCPRKIVRTKAIGNKARRKRTSRSGSLSSGERKTLRILKIAQKSLFFNPNVPEPEAYDISSGKSFVKFIEKFERYCESKYSCYMDDWIEVLGKYLQGEMKNIYRSACEGERPYPYIKNRLTQWYTWKKNNMDFDKRSQFLEAEMNNGESIFSYAYRLENLAYAAYPNIDIEKNRELRKKFMRTAPSSFVVKVKEQNWLGVQAGRPNLSWEDIKILASFGEDNHTIARKHSENWKEDEIEVAQLEFNSSQSGNTQRNNKRFTDTWNQHQHASSNYNWNNQQQVYEPTYYNHWPYQGKGYSRTNYHGSHANYRQEQGYDEWVPVCRQCKKVGHMERECYQGTAQGNYRNQQNFQKRRNPKQTAENNGNNEALN